MEDATDIQALVTIISELRPHESRKLYQMLAKRRKMNTSALQDGETVVMHLLRRAHRKIHPDWANPVRSPKKTKKSKGTIEQSFEQLTQETLAAEKDAGEVEIVSSEVSELI